jgi:hypothetical protein
MNVSKLIMQNLNRAGLVFAVCLLTLTSAFALTNETHNLSLDTPANNSFSPSAVFKSCWIDYNVTEGSRKGMRIHVNVEVTGLKGVDSKLVARVQKEDGEYLPSSSSYSNGDGELETSYSIKPGFETTVYEDAQMFLPYSEINLRKGIWALKLDVDLNYKAGELIQHLTFKEFEFNSTVSVNETPTKNGINATVKRIWIDQNVIQNGKKGMRIHVNFEVTGLKFVDSKLTVRVQKEDEYLAGSLLYSNGEGELEVSYPLKPALATTVYSDVNLFLPYSEIILRKGDWNLKLDVDVNYADGELIQHLDFYEFEFTK